MKKYLWVIGLVAIVTIGAVVFRSKFMGSRLTLLPSPSPSSAVISTPVAITPTLSPSPLTSPSPSLSKVALAVPFTIQAPDGQWVEPWEEGCEEAALLMVDAYVKGSQATTMPVAETKEKIKQMVDWQIGRYGAHIDIGVDEMAKVAREYLGYGTTNVRVEHNATLEDIRNELRQGRPVIVPAAGRLLNNPYFTPPGPIYHVFVITGFDGDNFIVNENGTKQGYNYQYSAEVLEQALHDYHPGRDIATGDVAYLVLSR